jgi:hypothetical protein
MEKYNTHSPKDYHCAGKQRPFQLFHANELEGPGQNLGRPLVLWGVMEY